jgi:hypothetical protein
MSRKILVLHGDRQTGDQFVGRIAALRKKLKKLGIDMEAPDGTFPWRPIPGVHTTRVRDPSHDKSESNDDLMRTWWLRDGSNYQGLDETFSRLQDIWSHGNFEGILGFSQGARLAYLLSLIHQASDGSFLGGLRYLILASGYGDVPLPTNLWRDSSSYVLMEKETSQIQIPSLHIMGRGDKLIPIQSSVALTSLYHNAVIYEHDGGHHVPMKSTDVTFILNFISSFTNDMIPSNNQDHIGANSIPPDTDRLFPDNEHAQIQTDEIMSLSLIFPDIFRLHSNVYESNGETIYDHPIVYSLQLRPIDMDESTAKLWPPKDISLRVEYTPDYPDVLPKFSIHHEMNLLELRLSIVEQCVSIARSKAESELGVPCIMSCFYAVKDFFDCGGLHNTAKIGTPTSTSIKELSSQVQQTLPSKNPSIATLLQAVSDQRLMECTLQGLEIARGILRRRHTNQQQTNSVVPMEENLDNTVSTSYGKGGYWQYTIGLLGKPSAGKSTFFNAATAFARQRGATNSSEGSDSDGFLFIGGASMAPHPFTTINPNVGYCLVPAPAGSCPEDDKDALAESNLYVGSTHGRSSDGRRFLPILLKDVAGLVPGAYQGRGKGNKVRIPILLSSFSSVYSSIGLVPTVVFR